MRRKIFIEIIALFFVVLFLYTAISKLMDYEVAKDQLASTPLLALVAREVVIIVPIAEIITAVLLFLPSTRKIGLFATLGLMLSFTAYIVYILNYNSELPCTCGGVLEQMSWPQHLIFNSCCIVLALTGILLHRNLKLHKREQDQNHPAIPGSHA
jgi:uncharacterized membrane protein YphA (DoxX/SURF4 family)